MKKIKFLILWLVLSIIWLSSFSSAVSWSCLGQNFLDVSEPSYLVPTNLSCSTSTCKFLFFWVPDTLIFTYYKDTNSFNQIILSWNYWRLQNWENHQGVFSVCDFDIVPIDTPTCPSCPTCEDCSSCQSSLGACLEDNVSLENMNQSLSDELTSCLESWGSGCNPEVDTGCVEGAIVPLLSWSVWLDSFTTPIINNLTLPTNYKWRIDDWVLTIASINSNLSIDDSDYWNIKSVFISVVLYTFGLGLMLILVYYIKFYFFNIKDK